MQPFFYADSVDTSFFSCCCPLLHRFRSLGGAIASGYQQGQRNNAAFQAGLWGVAGGLMSGLWSLADSLEGTAVSMTVYSKGQRVLGCKGIGQGKYGTVQGWAEKYIRPGLFEDGRVEGKEDHYVIHWDGIEEPQSNIWCGKVRDIKFCMPQFALPSKFPYICAAAFTHYFFFHLLTWILCAMTS